MPSAAPKGKKSRTFAAASSEKSSKNDVSERPTAWTTSPSSEISTTSSPPVGPNVRATMRTNDASRTTFRRKLKKCGDTEREALARTPVLYRRRGAVPVAGWLSLGRRELLLQGHEGPLERAPDPAREQHAVEHSTEAAAWLVLDHEPVDEPLAVGLEVALVGRVG